MQLVFDLLAVTLLALLLHGFLVLVDSPPKFWREREHNFVVWFPLSLVISIWIALLCLPAIYFVKVKKYSLIESIPSGIATSGSVLLGSMFIMPWIVLLIEGWSEKHPKRQVKKIFRLGYETLYVEYEMVTYDKEGYFIPDYGRIVGIHPPELEENEMIKERGGKVILICKARGEGNSESPWPQYVISEIKPL